MSVNCSRRNTRSAVILFFMVIGIYVPLSVIFTVSGSTRNSNKHRLVSRFENQNSILSTIHGTRHPTDLYDKHASAHNSEVSVKLKQIVPGPDGNVDLVLSVNVQDLLKNINIGEMNHGEATNNPVPYNPGFRIPNKNKCRESKGLKYIIYVHSSPSNSARRANIRSTWGNKDLFKDHRTNLVFIMGVPKDNSIQEDVVKESKLYGDIVQADYIDEYRNLTIKGIAGLKWVYQYCPEAKFAIKADDDAFVHIFELTKILDKNESYKKSVTCPLWGENMMPILRDPAKCMKWCVKYNEFPGQAYFPKYCAGLSFAISRDVVGPMYNFSFTTPQFWIDDVYISGLLLGKVSDVRYNSLLKNFTLKEKLALEQYSDFSKPITYYFVHIRTAENFPKIWELTLRRLSKTALKEVNENVVKKYKDIIRS